MPPIITTSNNQYSMTVPAHRFRQGGRDVYYFALTLDTIDGTLPQRVEDNVVREANRRLTPSHARNIQQYLDEKDDWLLGPMMLGIAHDAVEFDPYLSKEGEADTPNFGELRVRTNRMNTMRIRRPTPPPRYTRNACDAGRRRAARRQIGRDAKGFHDHNSVHGR